MGLLDLLALQEDKSHVKVSRLQNPDLVPMPPRRRTWNWWGFMSYWLMHNMSLSSFTSAASILSYGLSVPYVMAVVIIGNTMTLIHTILNGQAGADHHISFTTYARVMFGSYGFYLAIIIRAILGVVWYASQGWLGGLMINTMLSSLSHKYLLWQNTLPASVPFTSKELCGFVIFQLMIIPFIIKKPHQVRVVMGASALCGYFAVVGICIAAVVDNGGNGPLMSVHANTVHGSTFSWTIIKSLSQWYGSSCAGTLNKPDYTRFSKNKYTFIPGSIIGKLVLSTFVPFMGIVTASATMGKWGTTIWKPNMVMDNWLENYWTPGVRAGVFFSSLSLSVVQIVFNAVGNCWSFGMDFSGVCPKYINIRRGAIIACFLCWAIQPWTMYNTATNFGTVMTGFSVFISPMIALMICDYWVIRRRKLKLTDLYTDSPDGIYYGWKGLNVQALVTFFVSMAPGIPGLINAANPTIELTNQGILNYYYGNTLFGWFIAFFMYWGLCTIWKPKGLGEMDDADYYGTYSPSDCVYWGVIPQEEVDKDLLAKYVNVEGIEYLDTPEESGEESSVAEKENVLLAQKYVGNLRPRLSIS